MAFLVSLPVAFLALVPGERGVGRGRDRARRDLVRVPVQGRARRRRQRVQRRLAGDRLPLVHLAGLTIVFALVARLTLGRFAEA